MAGIKETQDVLKLVEVVTLSILKEVRKDGFQVEDLAAFLKSPKWPPALEEALQGVTAIPAEIEDIDLMEGLELGKDVYDMVSSVLGMLKGE